MEVAGSIEGRGGGILRLAWAELTWEEEDVVMCQGRRGERKQERTVRHVKGQLFLRSTSASGADPGLDAHNGGEHAVGLLTLVGDVGVFVHTEHLKRSAGVGEWGKHQK